MSLIKKVGYYDAVKKDGKIVAVGGFIDLMLEYDDKRFYNIPAPVVEGDKEYRDCCGAYFVLNVENSDENRIGSDLFYIDSLGEDFKFGSLTEGEINDIKYWLLQYALEDIKVAEMLEELTEEQLEEIYYVKTDKVKYE